MSKALKNKVKLNGLVTVTDFGAVGDGTTDDSAAFAAMFATNKPWYIPYTANGYKVSSTQTINADGVCDGTIYPTSAIGNAPTFIVADSGFVERRTIRGLRVIGNVSVRAAGVSGIRNDCNNSVLRRCRVLQLNYGVIARGYSQTYDYCSISQCNTNLSAYARSIITEINAMTILGGNYDSAVNVALNIGDASWPDAVAAGTSHGVSINIIGAVNTDGAESRIDNCASVLIEGTYSETTNTDCLWRLGGGGDGYLRNVTMRGNFWKSAKNAVRCYSGVEGLVVEDNFLSGITQSEVKLSTDLYGLRYRPGVQVGSFSEGQAVNLAFRSLSISQVSFDNFSLSQFGLVNGVQSSNRNVGTWFPSGTLRSSPPTIMVMNASSSCSFQTTPSVSKAGTVSGNVFTFTTKADSYTFTGGQRITTSPSGATYVRSVDYDNGTMVIDGGVTPNGAATVSQSQATFQSYTTTYTGTAPVGSGPLSLGWQRGDRATNGTATVGQPKGWLCTVTGSPGTWVSEGNL